MSWCGNPSPPIRRHICMSDSITQSKCQKTYSNRSFFFVRRRVVSLLWILASETEGRALPAYGFLLLSTNMTTSSNSRQDTGSSDIFVIAAASFKHSSLDFESELRMNPKRACMRKWVERKRQNELWARKRFITQIHLEAGADRSSNIDEPSQKCRRRKSRTTGTQGLPGGYNGMFCRQI